MTINAPLSDCFCCVEVKHLLSHGLVKYMVKNSKILLLIVGLLLTVDALVLLLLEQPNSNSELEVSENPSVPEFNISSTDHSYYVPPFGHVNLNTGEFDRYPGHFVRNGSVVLSIKNQPFTTYCDLDGHSIQLYYHIRARSHGTNEWHYYPIKNYFVASNSSATEWVFTYLENELQYGSNDSLTIPRSESFDFQAEALIGYANVTRQSIAPHNLVVAYVGHSSGWSNIQTIKVPPSTAYIPPTLASP